MNHSSNGIPFPHRFDIYDVRKRDVQRAVTPPRRRISNTVVPPITISPPRPGHDESPILRNPSLQLLCMSIISKIDADLYERTFREQLSISDVDARIQILNSELTARSIYKLYLKGGNTMAYQLHAYADGRGFPFPVESDYDIQLLIHPGLSNANYNKLRAMLFRRILLSIADTSELWANTSGLWDGAITELKAIGKTMQDLPEAPIRIGGIYAGPADESVAAVLHEPKVVERIHVPTGCPFRIEAKSNTTHDDKTPDNIAVIKFIARTTQYIELIDIVIPSKNYTNLQIEWDMHDEFRIHDTAMGIEFNFRVADPVSTYIDQIYAGAQTGTNQKSVNRTRRAHRIRNTILRPLRNTFRNSLNRISALPHTLKGRPLRNYIANI